MNKLFDLRFVIGSFFSIVGLLLLIYSLASKVREGQSINSWCGVLFLVFGVLMILLSFRKDAHDELLEES
ncbi:MAG: hypothetical protein ACTHMD_19270 [Flavisolibacter sp.]